MQYNNMNINNEMLCCTNEGEDEMYECLSCEKQSNHETKITKYICCSCKMKCHDQTHNFQCWDVEDEKNKKCECVVCTK